MFLKENKRIFNWFFIKYLSAKKFKLGLFPSFFILFDIVIEECYYLVRKIRKVGKV